MSFDLQPVLVGELLELRPLRADDFDALFAVASDALIWEQHPERETVSGADVPRLFSPTRSSRVAPFVALDRANGQIIGSSRFFGFDAQPQRNRDRLDVPRAKLLGRAIQRRDEAVHARARVQVRGRVIFVIGPDNRRSQRAVEKPFRGCVPACRVVVRGQERVVYELTPALYAQRPRSSAA